MEYLQLHNQQKVLEIWNTLYWDEMERLCKGLGKVSDSKGQQIAGTDTFHVINYENITAYRSK